MLEGMSYDPGVWSEPAEGRRSCVSESPGDAVGSMHPRRGRVIEAIAQVLRDGGSPLQARTVHAQVEDLLGEPVRWATVKASLAGNLNGSTPRFVRVARGRYGLPQRRGGA